MYNIMLNIGTSVLCVRANSPKCVWKEFQVRVTYESMVWSSLLPYICVLK
jgi:hypothetical protein